jgi:hypothetical protein
MPGDYGGFELRGSPDAAPNPYARIGKMVGAGLQGLGAGMMPQNMRSSFQAARGVSGDAMDQGQIDPGLMQRFQDWSNSPAVLAKKRGMQERPAAGGFGSLSKGIGGGVGGPQ